MEKKKICIVTFKVIKAGVPPLSNLVDVLLPQAERLSVITGGEGYDLVKSDGRIRSYEIRHEVGSNVPSRILRYGITQMRIARRLIGMRKDTDSCIFLLAGDKLLLPILALKLMRKEVVLAPTDYIIQPKNDALSVILKSFLDLNYRLSDKIVLHSEGLIRTWGLERHKGKIIVAHEYFIDYDEFKISAGFSERKKLIGFIGRLSEEKGILNFLESIPEVLKTRDDLGFFVGGSGPLDDAVRKYVEENGLGEKVILKGWIPHDRLPGYLNDLKLLVIPSYGETGPLIAFEAMACGTPVLSTRVGQMDDIVTDCLNGFLMDSNEPEVISKNILRSIDYLDGDSISREAVKSSKENFTYEAAFNQYKKVFYDG